MSKWKQVRRYTLWSALVLALLFIAGAWFVGGTLVAPANRKVGQAPTDLPFQSEIILSESGSMLATWYLPNPNSSSTLILLPPIRGDRRSMLSRARLFHKSGFSILLIDFQAHGEDPL